MLVDPDFLLRVVRDPAAKPAAYRLSDLELASRLSFFLVEQHSRRSSADAGRTQGAEQSAESGKRSAPHAGRSARHRRAGERFRRAVAESAPGRRCGGRSDQVSQLRRESAAGVPAGDRDVRGQHAARGSPRGGSAECGLHLRQRTARAALRDSGSLRQPLPARDASRSRSARRSAGAGRAAGDHVLSRSHVAGAARQMAAEQYFRHCPFRRRRRE